MTSPFTTVTATEPGDYWKPEEHINGLMIVRPIKYQESGYITEYRPEGMDAMFCDIAVLDAVNDDGTKGKIFRNASVLQGYLKGTFKRYLGHTLVGAVILGPKAKGQKPPYMWTDLSGDPASVAVASTWLQANQRFLVEITSVTSVAQQSTPPAAVAAAQALAAGAQPVVTQQMPNTLAQLQAMAAATSHHGTAQPDMPPF